MIFKLVQQILPMQCSLCRILNMAVSICHSFHGENARNALWNNVVIHYKETYQNWNVSYVHVCQNVYEVMIQLLLTLIWSYISHDLAQIWENIMWITKKPKTLGSLEQSFTFGKSKEYARKGWVSPGWRYSDNFLKNSWVQTAQAPTKPTNHNSEINWFLA